MPLYFAYGSNLDDQEIRTVCPSARYLYRAMLRGFRPAFTHRKVNGSGALNVVEDATRHVWGVVYDIPDSELPGLDKKEGFKPGRERSRNSYVRMTRAVLREPDQSQPVDVLIYEATRNVASHVAPLRVYRDLVIRGARARELPTDYIAMLERLADGLPS